MLIRRIWVRSAWRPIFPSIRTCAPPLSLSAFGGQKREASYANTSETDDAVTPVYWQAVGALRGMKDRELERKRRGR